MKNRLRLIIWGLLLALSTGICAMPDQVTTSYLQAVNKAINAAAQRPIVEMDLQETGIITVSFDCTDNIVTNLKVDISSRVRAFDLAALNAVKSAKFPAVPPELQHKTIHITVVVHIPAALR